MAGNGTETPKFLTPPTILALRQEARDDNSRRVPMERTLSEDMRAEREDLREAAEQTLNIILDLGLDGRIKWVSPSWRRVVGSAPESVEGKMISDILLSNQTAFQDAVESMKEDDSRSRFIRFAMQMGPDSLLEHSLHSPVASQEDNAPVNEGQPDTGIKEQGSQRSLMADHPSDLLNMEAQGIMVYDRSADGEGHTMWMLRPSTPPREVTIDLPPLLVESLGVGAEVLANHLTSLAEWAANDPDPAKIPPSTPVLCRICERQINPWWFEKHSDLCLQEHRAEMDVQLAQENLNEHRHTIVKALDALEARQSRQSPGEGFSPTGAVPEYKGLPIGPSPVSSGPGSSAGSSSPATPPRSRDPSTSGFGHARTRSFAVRRPLARIVELILDLCDTALEISTPALKESRIADTGDDLRTLSPQSESRISQVLQWHSPSSNTLEQEQGLAALAADTEQVAKAKVDAVLRHRDIVEYGERIRVEYAVLVEECVSAAMNKAERIAAGELSDTSSSSDQAVSPQDLSELEQDGPQGPVLLPPQAPTTEAMAQLRDSSEPSISSLSPQGGSSVAVSTRSASPMECPTPRSHKSAAGLLSTQLSKRGSLLAESDAGENSDSSAPSSIFPGGIRTESPSLDKGLARATSARDRKRRSLILQGLASGSSRRQQSPARIPNPQSPLRLSKPRLPSGESMPSPNISPLLNTSELAAQGLPPHSQHHLYHQHQHHHHHHSHHRRQSSATSSDILKVPISPHLTSVSQPQPRPAPPSIKDFEIIKPISKGAFGSVFLSKKKVTGEYFAIKVLKKADMVAKNQVTNVKAERAIMMWEGESDFVAKLYWTFSSKDYLYLVMEYLNGGDCASLVKVLGGLPEDWAKKYIAEVVLGVEHLHNRGIVHRDLKPDNFLIDQKGHLKLTDFGLSRMGLVGRQKRALKSPNESAPDLLKQGPFPRTVSLASSRSASFDFQTNQSPSSTPLITPDTAGSYGQPSYFSLGQNTLSRENSRRASGYRSDSGGSDSLNAVFRAFSLHDGGETPAPLLLGTPCGLPEEEAQSEGGDSPHLYPLQQTLSRSSTLHSTPPQQTMLPPPMALFDPDDHSRRFVGTPDYLAPETINGVGQDEMSDWWSLGCIMFEFLYGSPPFNAPTPDSVFENILHRRINWPEHADELASPEAIDLMNKLMTINPQERLGANVNEKFPNGGAEIRGHPWFSDINWDTLLEDKAQFVPITENPEDTEYFDSRGATLQEFTEEMEDQPPNKQPVAAGDYADRPHDALFKARSQGNSAKRGLMPLHIPPHVRDSRSRRLSEPVMVDDFGNFNFKNLPMLEKANKDVIQRLRQEAMQVQQRAYASTAQTPVSSSGPSLEGSPLLPMPLQRALSQNKGSNRPNSPSSHSQANSSPSRPSQPSSPLLVQFSTGQNLERRKTSGSSSTQSHQSAGPLSSEKLADAPRLTTSIKITSPAPSPSKPARVAAQSPEKAISGNRQLSVSTSRARSQTIGSQDSEPPSSRESLFLPGHHKRRSQLFDVSPSSSDNEDPRAKALLKVQRRRQSSRRLSQINLLEGPFFRPLDVLICEDHPVSRLVMERLFEKLRCRTITASNGAEALRYALSEVEFDIIMTEVKLPQINGADVSRMVRETRSPNTHTPIIAVTGYLKDLPETHHFDGLIEKPPTISKLTETLCKFCQWKPPPKDYAPTQPLSIPSSMHRQNSLRTEDSPSSTSSGFAHISSSSYRGSSQEDSLGSIFGDMDSIKSEEAPVIISHHVDDWGPGHGGLGISEDPPAISSDVTEPKLSSNLIPFPNLPHTAATPPSTSSCPSVLTSRKQRSTEGIRAKRESRERMRHEGAESGDDEDEELGSLQVRARSPRAAKTPRSSSKLGTEMMRTNSHGSVVSGSEESTMGHIKYDNETDTADEDKEALGSPGDSELDEKFQGLHIQEDTAEDFTDDQPEVCSSYERSESMLSGRERNIISKRPPLYPSHQFETEIHSPSKPLGQSISEQPGTSSDKTPTTPSFCFPQKDSKLDYGRPRAGARTGLVRLNSDESIDARRASAHTTGDVDVDTDAGSTPKPAPTPVPRDADLESEPTPRATGKSPQRPQHREDRSSILPWRRR
ncbi:hypothetical protein V8E54_014081 [Elaphomyces granulatus]